ncbi:MAG: DoxX family protein [Cytophagaceae bacterium]|nr:DoxX family protein [Cytophagaceae bacterium]
MKFLANLCRILVGAVFVFSGLIKLNDPVGTQIKLEEYFEVFAQDWSWSAPFWEALVPYALGFSVFLCVLEVVLGVALLVNYRLRLTAWVLLVTTIFFGFLTFYSAYFNKVTDCGCFGEAIKLEPWTSFGKDVVLGLLTLVILWQRDAFRSARTGWVVALTTVACLGIGIYAIRHLPPVDLLAYKVGDNIPKNMKASEPLRFRYIMEKGGQTKEFDQYPTDTTYKFKDMVLLNESAKPRITDYRIWNDTTDFTEGSFRGKKLFIIIQDVKKAHLTTLEQIKALARDLENTDVTPIVLTSSPQADFDAFRHEHQLAVPYYFADFKVLKTIIRTNPGLWLLQDGVVKGKWSYLDVPTKADVLANR